MSKLNRQIIEFSEALDKIAFGPFGSLNVVLGKGLALLEAISDEIT